MRPELYILAYNRPELLACCLASICGWQDMNGAPIYVVDDHSSDWKVAALLAKYEEARFIKGFHIMPQHGGIGQIRRWMIDHFLSHDATHLVQVESDVVVGPGQIAALLKAYAALKSFAPDAHFLNVFHHFWVRPQLKVIAWTAPDGTAYRVGITRGGSEPFWVTDTVSLAKARGEGLLPAERPDLVLWLDRYCGATLYQPEISAQHLGAGRSSLYYDYFAWTNVVFREQNEKLKDSGPLRRPYPFLSYDFDLYDRMKPECFRQAYELFRGACPKPLPDFPQ